MAVDRNWAQRTIDFVESFWPIFRTVLSLFARSPSDASEVGRIEAEGSESDRVQGLGFTGPTGYAYYDDGFTGMAIAPQPGMDILADGSVRMVDGGGRELHLYRNGSVTLNDTLARPQQDAINPDKYKSAFASADIFIQQMNPSTHDPGLQLMLDVIHRWVETWAGCELIPLIHYRFTVNFAAPLRDGAKWYSVKMQHPLVRQFKVKRVMEEGSLHVHWYVVHNDQEVLVDPVKGPAIEKSREVENNRESRRIELRDN